MCRFDEVIKNGNKLSDQRNEKAKHEKFEWIKGQAGKKVTNQLAERTKKNENSKQISYLIAKQSKYRQTKLKKKRTAITSKKWFVATVHQMADAKLILVWDQKKTTICK